MKPHKIGVLIFFTAIITQFQGGNVEIATMMIMIRLESEGNPCEEEEKGKKKRESMGFFEEGFN